MLTTLIEELRARLSEIAADLNAAGEHKRGTDWWSDRENEAAWLRKEIERLEARREASR